MKNPIISIIVGTFIVITTMILVERSQYSYAVSDNNQFEMSENQSGRSDPSVRVLHHTPTGQCWIIVAGRTVVISDPSVCKSVFGK